MPIYLNQGEQSNKFWEYEIIGNDVKVKWGRVGLDGQEKIHNFSNPSARDSFIAKKVAEKEKKGYTRVTEAKLNQEREVADCLGHQYKIKRVKWVAKTKNANKLRFLLSYDPTQYVYVEILNSWKKKVHRLLLSKTESLEIDGIAESDRVIEYDSSTPAAGNFADGVRSYLRNLAQKVTAAVVKYASLGVRVLDLGLNEDEGNLPEQLGGQAQDFYEEIGESGASSQVINTFAGLDARVLDL